jgi:2-oxoglutarate ferredoxin oxidoreductase subunit beta
MVYGLTKGQASPTSQLGFRTPVQIKGVLLEPFNPLSLAISLGASFVARAFAGDVEQTKDILKMAISHKGYALVDILQPCVSFNKLNTFQWFKEKTYYLEDSYDPENRDKALHTALQQDRFPLGVIFKHMGKRTFEEKIGIYDRDPTPLSLRRTRRKENLKRLIQTL